MRSTMIDNNLERLSEPEDRSPKSSRTAPCKTRMIQSGGQWCWEWPSDIFQNLITPGLVVKKEAALCIHRYGPLCTARNQQAPTVCFSSLHNGSAVTVSQGLQQSWDCTCLAWAQGSAVRGCFLPRLAPLPFCTAALPQGARADTSPGAT